MKKILFTDTHFGVKQNSINWLNSQKQFIYNQFIPYINKLNEQVEVIHLGDVFDSRSSISTYIANEVVNIFKDICGCKNVIEVNIVSGNHDFYSPNSSSINTINLILSNIDDKIKIIYNTNYIKSPYLYVPWYEWFDQKNIQNIVDKYNIEYIFTHADIITSPVNVVGAKVFSGHTHIPYIKNNIYNLGSCYSLDFGDSNNSRGFYILYEDGKLEYIENTESIRFWRLFNDDIFNNYKHIKINDYIEIYIDQSKLGNPKYADRLNYFMNNYKNINILPQMTEIKGMKFKDFQGYDIKSMVYEIIPENLKEKFNKIIEKYKQD